MYIVAAPFSTMAGTMLLAVGLMIVASVRAQFDPVCK